MMNRTYFKDLREKATAEMLNKSEMVYNGYQNNEYIRRLLRAFIGELTTYAASVGIDTVYPLDGHDTGFTVIMKAADSYVKAYRTQAKYEQAIEGISELFVIYDGHYFENDIEEDEDDELFGDFKGEPLTEEELEEDEDNIYDLIMNAKRSDIKTETFYLNNGYYMDAVTNNIEHTFEFFIYHKSCGIKMLMFGLPQSQQDYDDAVEMAFYNTEEYIDEYDEEYHF